MALEYGDLGSQLISWPKEHVVKCLAFYHPQDSAELKARQDQTLLDVYQACCRTGHELLLEIILPADMEQKEQYYHEIITHLYRLGIKPDWWKLPGMSAGGWSALSRIIEQNDSYCRGILILGLDAPETVFDETFKAAADAPLVKGFAVGRTIFAEPSADWLAGNLNDQQLIDAVSERYQRLIRLWKKYRA